MTTIAANREFMWCDTMVTHGDLRYQTAKVYRHKGDLIGCAGDNAGIERFLRWYCGTKRKAQIELQEKESFDAMVLSKRGLYIYSGCSLPDSVDSDIYAIGTGAMAFLGAYRAGVSVLRAMQIACEIDVASALPVIAFPLRVD